MRKNIGGYKRSNKRICYLSNRTERLCRERISARPMSKPIMEHYLVLSMVILRIIRAGVRKMCTDDVINSVKSIASMMTSQYVTG